MRIFAVSGFSKTGKTTTIEALTKEFCKQSYSVATIKDSRCEDLVLDTLNTDTYKHSAAGARQVTLRGLWGTAVIYKRRLSLAEILEHYNQDIIILEGFGKYDLPKIITAKTAADVSAKLSPQTFAVSGIISQTATRCQGLPVINALNEADRLCSLILNNMADTGNSQFTDYLKQVI
ncbi:MAG: molybdopterin-guanine dinucleotide biosynthesis protein B [Clostridia bacterium]|nr:molybdopterin-guanine dinucleotide biosynthesis protein B [Clostridia bacterium]MDD4572509.1 molybdopterin-guanine dinucleotide biosynthesis protein B [Clostridia bacterium]